MTIKDKIRDSLQKAGYTKGQILTQKEIRECVMSHYPDTNPHSILPCSDQSILFDYFKRNNYKIR
jgi:hypothetical protein